jgi:hypothetical protein
MRHRKKARELLRCMGETVVRFIQWETPKEKRQQ